MRTKTKIPGLIITGVSVPMIYTGLYIGITVYPSAYQPMDTVQNTVYT